MTPGTATRPIGLRPTSVLALVLLLALVLAPVPAAAQQTASRQTASPHAASPQAPSQQAQEPLSVSIGLVDRSPWVGPEQTLVLDLDIAFSGDNSAEAASTTRLRTRFHRALRDLDELDAARSEDVGVVIAAVDAGTVDALPLLDTGTRRLEVSVPIETAGVYPVAIDAVAANGAILATLRTSLVVLGPEDDPIAAPRLSLLVDVAVDPTIEPEGRRTLTEAELDRAERLAGLLESGHPLTLVPLPDTVEALAATADPRAERLVAALSGATSGRTALARPYVAVDAAALARSGLLDALDALRATGLAVLDERVASPLDTNVWPDGRDVDAAAATHLGSTGVDHVLVPGSEVIPVADPDLLLGSGPVPIRGFEATDIAALVVDDRLSARLAGPAPEGPDAAHHVLAELILRSGGRTTDVIVRVDDVVPTSAIGTALDLLFAPDSPVEVGALGEPEPASGAPIAAPDAGGSPTESPTGELPTDEYRAAEQDLGTFRTLVGPDSARTASLELQLLTSLADDLADEERRALIDDVVASVDEGFEAVHLTGQTDLNLTSRRGDLPITVINENDFPVTIEVRIRSDRLDFPEGEAFTVEVGTEPARLDIPVEARATGSVPTFVELWTTDGRTLLDERQLDVRSTAVSGVGLALSLGALAVLAVWWLRTWFRSRRAGHHDEDVAQTQ